MSPPLHLRKKLGPTSTQRGSGVVLSLTTQGEFFQSLHIVLLYIRRYKRLRVETIVVWFFAFVK
jgi:hypothetical protein